MPLRDLRNAVLLAEGINRSVKHGIRVPSNPHDIVEEYCCESGRSECMQGTCTVCVPSGLEAGSFELVVTDESSEVASCDSECNDIEVSFNRWVREDGKIQKRTISMDVEDVIENWYETITVIKKHIDIKRHQYTSYQSQRDNLKLGEVLIHCDYNENYKKHSAK